MDKKTEAIISGFRGLGFKVCRVRVFRVQEVRL